jgi:hypothetical protein
MTRGVHPSVTTRERKGELALALCGLAARAEHLWHVGPAIGRAAAAEAVVPGRGVRVAGWTGSEMAGRLGRPIGEVDWAR